MAKKVALVTGAASGIGRGVTGRLVAAGYAVLATDVNAEALEAASREWPDGAVATRTLDVRDETAWEDALDDAERRWGTVTHLLNVAGVIRPGFLLEQGVDAIDFHLDINTRGVIVGTRAAALRMKASGGGHIVNVASMAGIAPVSGLALYTTSKFAVRGFSLAVAGDLRPHGIAVTVVCPDAVDTPMLEQQIDDDAAALTFSGARALTPEEVVDAIVDRVLVKRPVELVMPQSRAAMAKLSSAFPSTVRLLDPIVRGFGRRRQAAIRRSRGGGDENP